MSLGSRIKESKYLFPCSLTQFIVPLLANKINGNVRIAQSPESLQQSRHRDIQSLGDDLERNDTDLSFAEFNVGDVSAI